MCSVGTGQRRNAQPDGLASRESGAVFIALAIMCTCVRCSARGWPRGFAPLPTQIFSQPPVDRLSDYLAAFAADSVVRSQAITRLLKSGANGGHGSIPCGPPLIVMSSQGTPAARRRSCMAMDCW
jgi:hypothetical protein